MEIFRNRDFIEKLISANGGYITRRELNEHKIPSSFLSDYVAKHHLIRYATGFYAEESWLIDDYFIFQYEYPKLIYSFCSAAYLHGLIDSVPPFMEVTGPKNYRPFLMPREGVFLHTDTRDNVYSLGIIKLKNAFGHNLFVYDIEKTVCDFIRNRKKIDSETFVKCIRSYVKRNDKNIINLMNYAKIMKIEEHVHALMEVMLNEN